VNHQGTLFLASSNYSRLNFLIFLIALPQLENINSPQMCLWIQISLTHTTPNLNSTQIRSHWFENRTLDYFKITKSKWRNLSWEKKKTHQPLNSTFKGSFRPTQACFVLCPVHVLYFVVWNCCFYSFKWTLIASTVNAFLTKRFRFPSCSIFGLTDIERAWARKRPTSGYWHKNKTITHTHTHTHTYTYRHYP
jgi:hypothetical protein